MLKSADALLLIIDVQEKLFRVIHGKEQLLSNLQKLAKGCRLLGVPALLTEQNPAGLGPTVPELAALMPEAEKVIKFSFSCCAEADFNERIKATGRRQILICGIESHICVYQTAMDLLAAGYEVQVVCDCVSSRLPDNKDLALRRLETEGAKLTGVEMALFELLRTAKSERFKGLSVIVKE
jgi:nicotinamidase-related amidase